MCTVIARFLHPLYYNLEYKNETPQKDLLENNGGGVGF